MIVKRTSVPQIPLYRPDQSVHVIVNGHIVPGVVHQRITVRKELADEYPEIKVGSTIYTVMVSHVKLRELGMSLRDIGLQDNFIALQHNRIFLSWDAACHAWKSMRARNPSTHLRHHALAPA